MRHLTTGELLELYRRVVLQSGGALGVRDLGALESALAQPNMTFEGKLHAATRGSQSATLERASVVN